MSANANGWGGRSWLIAITLGLAIGTTAAIGCGRGKRTPHDDRTARGGAAPDQPTETATAVGGSVAALSDYAGVAAGDGGAGQGCSRSGGLSVPADPGSPGPWPVGVRTIELSGLTTEVWYPAAAGSEVGHPPVTYDLRDQLPKSQRSKIPDRDRPLLSCDCYRDLPLDREHGPYPVVVFVHGYTLFAVQSVTLTRHWASRGFVVIAPDLPGATLAGSQGAGRRGGEVDQVRALLEALPAVHGEALPAAALDLDHLGLVGHSLGGAVVARLGGRPGVAVVVAISEGGIRPAARRFSSLVIGGTDDAVEAYAEQVAGFAESPRPKRLLGIAGAGHMAASDLCAGELYTRIRQHQVKLDGFAAKMARRGCADGTLALARGWAVIAYATTAALEEPLGCPAESAASLAGIATRFPDEVAEYREEL